MLNKQEFLKEEMDCAKLLGMTLEEYRKSCKNVKAPKKEKQNKNITYDNSLLKLFGVDERILKKKEC